MKTLNLQYTGRKSRIGKICFDEEGKLVVFVNYCPSCKKKVVMTVDEAKQFARLYQAEEGSWSSRLLFNIIGRRQATVTPHDDYNERAELANKIAQKVARELMID